MLFTAIPSVKTIYVKQRVAVKSIFSIYLFCLEKEFCCFVFKFYINIKMWFFEYDVKQWPCSSMILGVIIYI